MQSERAKLGNYTLKHARKLLLSALSGLFFLISACDNTVDINAPWKEVLVVYGLLNPTDSVHFIKINKAFLNENTGALEAAATSDSLYFDDLEVKVIRVEDNVIFTCIQDNSIRKDSGLFAYDRNTLWTFKSRLSQFNNYRIDITRRSTGLKVTAQTAICGPASVLAPAQDTFSTLNLQLENIPVIYSSGQNTGAYDVQMELVYDEFPAADTFIKTRKSITWNMLRDQRTNFFGGGVRLTNIIPRTAFFQFVAARIKADPLLRRRVQHVNIRFYGGAPQLVDYISVSEPSIGIVQKQADYTNITNGLGIFSSRYIQTIPRVKLDQNSKLVFNARPEIKPLNFVF